MVTILPLLGMHILEKMWCSTRQMPSLKTIPYATTQILKLPISMALPISMGRMIRFIPKVGPTIRAMIRRVSEKIIYTDREVNL